MNIVALIGRACADPEIREIEGKKGKEDLMISSVTLAVDRIGSEEADFIRCKAFGKTAEFFQNYVRKGQKIGVTGRMQTGSYEDKEGITRYTTDVIVDRVTFADGKKEDDDDGGKKYKKGRK